MSSKTVLPERCAIVSSKGALQECHLSVSTQGVSQVGSLENVRNEYCLCSLNIRVGIWVRGLHLVYIFFIGYWGNIYILFLNFEILKGLNYFYNIIFRSIIGELLIMILKKVMG